MSLALPEPRPCDIALDGRRIEAAWWGPGPEAAPSVVMLHEGLGCVALWRDVPARIAAATGLGVLAYSRFGYGRSDPVPLPRPLTYLHEEALGVLPRVLAAAAIRRCILFGHSDGASIAAIHAGSREDARVRGLVLMAGHYMVEAAGMPALLETRRRYEEGDLRARLARHHAHVDVAFRGWSEAWTDPRFAAAFDLAAELARIRVPVLVVQGEADPYGTLEQVRVVEREARHCPVETLVLPGVGHAPHLEAPEAVLAAVRDFAARLLRAGGPADEKAPGPAGAVAVARSA
jgi:pimeloyl-ACP methyl ester carboxylesterase